jgi:hypothetical protein
MVVVKWDERAPSASWRACPAGDQAVCPLPLPSPPSMHYNEKALLWSLEPSQVSDHMPCLCALNDSTSTAGWVPPSVWRTCQQSRSLAESQSEPFSTEAHKMRLGAPGSDTRGDGYKLSETETWCSRCPSQGLQLWAVSAGSPAPQSTVIAPELWVTRHSVLFSGTGSHCVAQAGLKLKILLPQPPECWCYRPASSRSECRGSFTEACSHLIHSSTIKTTSKQVKDHSWETHGAWCCNITE